MNASSSFSWRRFVRQTNQNTRRQHLLRFLPLADQNGKVVKTYENELVAWLKARDGFEGTTEEARAHFDALAPEQQRIFLRDVYFAELTAGGREYNDVNSSRHSSYLRGRNVIATLFPSVGTNGQPITYAGDITMFGGSGVRTIQGGDIQMLTPGGRTVIGAEGQVPLASSGLIIQGDGNIQRERRKKDERASFGVQNYNAGSKFQVIGNGELTDEEKSKLIEEERSQL